MEVSGKIIAVLPVQEGTSKAGNTWKKSQYVLETHDTYPRKVAFTVFGVDRVAQYQHIKIGDEVTVSFDIDSREWQGRWYTDITAWKIEQAAAPAVAQPGAVAAPAAPVADAGAVPPPPAVPFAQTEPSDDLPF